MSLATMRTRTRVEDSVSLSSVRMQTLQDTYVVLFIVQYTLGLRVICCCRVAWLLLTMYLPSLL